MSSNPQPPSASVTALVQRLRALAERLRANRYEVHGGCCDDGDEAVPCASPVCDIEYEAEVALNEAALALAARPEPERPTCAICGEQADNGIHFKRGTLSLCQPCYEAAFVRDGR